MRESKKYFKRLFTKRRFDIQTSINSFYVNNGIVELACRADSLNDIINPLSVPGYDYISDALKGYIDYAYELLPENMPVALNISGCEFSDHEKKRIKDAIWNYFEIELVKAQKSLWKHFFRIIWFALFFAVTVAVFLISRSHGHDLAIEFIYVVFYFLGDRLVEYLFLDGKDYRLDKRRLAQLSSMDVIFSPGEFNDRDLTDEEADRITENVIANAECDEV